jgi:hypothetical protein
MAHVHTRMMNVAATSAVVLQFQQHQPIKFEHVSAIPPILIYHGYLGRAVDTTMKQS